MERYINSNEVINADLIALTLNETAEQTLTQKHNSINKYFITTHTWELIEKRENLKQQNKHDEACVLNKEIQTDINKYKRNDKREKLEERYDKRMYKWDQIKTPKHHCTPKVANFKDDQGNRIPYTNKAEAAAAFLETRQWNKTNEIRNGLPISRTHQIIERNHMRDKNFSNEEITDVINSLKNNKAAGIDKNRSELFKWLGVKICATSPSSLTYI